jgi:hypothetical protein
MLCQLLDALQGRKTSLYKTGDGEWLDLSETFGVAVGSRFHGSDQFGVIATE